MRDTRTESERKKAPKGAIIDRAGGKDGMQIPAQKRKPNNNRSENDTKVSYGPPPGGSTGPKGQGPKRRGKETGSTTRTPAPKTSRYSGKPGKSSQGPGKESKSGRDVKGDFTKKPGNYPAVMDSWTNPKTGESTSLTRGYKPKEGSGWERVERGSRSGSGASKPGNRGGMGGGSGASKPGNRGGMGGGSAKPPGSTPQRRPVDSRARKRTGPGKAVKGPGKAAVDYRAFKGPGPRGGGAGGSRGRGPGGGGARRSGYR